MYTLKCTKRTRGAKSARKEVRRSGAALAVLYGSNKENQLLTVDGASLALFFRQLPKGTLSTAKIQLDIEGEKVDVIVKGIEYEKITYNVLHIDFLRLDAKTLVNIRVPLQYEGIDVCAGVKQGGFLRRVMRMIRIRTLPKNIPTFFSKDIRALNIGDRVTAKELVCGDVTLMDSPDAVVAIIAKK